MNLREFDAQGTKKQLIRIYVYLTIALIASLFLSLINCFLVKILSIFLYDYSIGKTTITLLLICFFIMFSLIFCFMARVFKPLRRIVFFSIHPTALQPFRYIFNYSNWHEANCICTHCLSNVYLSTEKDEVWTCNHCEKTFDGHILDLCPHCDCYQRLFECPHCGKLIDIDAEYNEKELEQKRHDKQTELIPCILGNNYMHIYAKTM